MGVLLGLATLALAEGDTHKAASLLTEAQVWRERWRERTVGGRVRREKKGKERGREGEREETEKEEAGGCI